jgi:hypothetical protein
MMYVMQIELHKKPIMQCGVPLCQECRISKLTVETPITPPQVFRWRKMYLMMQICDLKYTNQPPKKYVMKCMF